MRCECCGKLLTGKQRRYCSEPCRKRVSRHGPIFTDDGAEPEPSKHAVRMLELVTEELRQAGVLDTVEAQLTVRAAEAFGSPRNSATDTVAASKEFSRARAAALQGTPRGTTGLDELQTRRQRRRWRP